MIPTMFVQVKSSCGLVLGQMVKKFAVRYEVWMFIVLSTRGSTSPYRDPVANHSVLSRPMYLSFILMLLTTVYLGLSRSFFPAAFLTKMLYVFLVAVVRVAVLFL
jgi:hypothetical protein